MENLSPQESLKIIESIIERRKQKYEENGFLLMFWGALTVIAALAQYIMIINNFGHISGYAWLFTMVPGFIFTIIYSIVKRKKNTKQNVSNDTFGFVWFAAGTAAMLTGFIFLQKIWGQSFLLVMYMPFIFASLTSSLAIKNKLWLILSILSLMIAYASLFVGFMYFPLISALLSLILYLVPGINLFINYKKRQNV